MKFKKGCENNLVNSMRNTAISSTKRRRSIQRNVQMGARQLNNVIGLISRLDDNVGEGGAGDMIDVLSSSSTVMRSSRHTGIYSSIGSTSYMNIRWRRYCNPVGGSSTGGCGVSGGQGSCCGSEGGGRRGRGSNRRKLSEQGHGSQEDNSRAYHSDSEAVVRRIPVSQCTNSPPPPSSSSQPTDTIRNNHSPINTTHTSTSSPQPPLPPATPHQSHHHHQHPTNDNPSATILPTYMKRLSLREHQSSFNTTDHRSPSLQNLCPTNTFSNAIITRLSSQPTTNYSSSSDESYYNMLTSSTAANNNNNNNNNNYNNYNNNPIYNNEDLSAAYMDLMIHIPKMHL